MANLERMVSDHKDLERLSKELDASLQRIDKLQKGQSSVPIGRRLYRWASSPALLGALVTGAVFTIALQRLEEKREYEAKRAAFEEERSQLLADMQRLRDEADARLASVRGNVQAELAGPSRGMADRVRRALATTGQAAPANGPAPAKPPEKSGAGRFMI